MLIRTFAAIALAVVLVSGFSLRAAGEVPIVWTASSIGPAYTEFQTPSCSAEPTSCPIFSITGAGGLTPQEDVYAFTHRILRGDGYLVARVSGINGTTSALAGLSIRASLSPGAAQLSLMQSASGGLVVRKRIRAGVPVYQTKIVLPVGAAWLKLERRGAMISLAESADGSQWASIPGATIELPDTAYAGLAVSSQQPDATATATFSNVQLVSQSSLPDGWATADLGGTGFSSQTLYTGSFWTLEQWQTSTATSDGTSYLYQRVSGDAEVSVRLLGLSEVGTVAGLQIRGTLESDSPYVWLMTDPSGERSAERRQAAGLPSTIGAVGAGIVPGWIKLVRQGTVVRAYQSADGSSWELLTTEAIDLPESIYLGVALSRAGSSAGVAAFDDVRVEAIAANQLPSVSLTSPSPASSVFEGESVAISADASDSDDRVDSVEFFVDGTRVGVDTVAPYLANWLAAGAGSHQVTAVVRDSDGALVEAASVPILVLARESYETSGSSPTPPTPVSSTDVPPPTPVSSPEVPPPPPVSSPDVPVEPSVPPPASAGETWRLVFAPSINHYDIVDRYTAEIYSLDQRAVVGARDLGWPAVLEGECNVDLSHWIGALPGGQYQIVVRAVDDSTAAQSAGATFDFVR